MLCVAKDEIKRKAKLSGREEGIAGAILICRNLGIGFENTVNQIANQFKRNMSEAEAITRKYWEFE